MGRQWVVTVVHHFVDGNAEITSNQAQRRICGLGSCWCLSDACMIASMDLLLLRSGSGAICTQPIDAQSPSRHQSPHRYLNSIASRQAERHKSRSVHGSIGYHVLHFVNNKDTGLVMKSHAWSLMSLLSVLLAP